ncbi:MULTISPECIES: hypothetical protein [unclassified Streptomyces]|uniref:hypothetical protein n=1 Tax=unclassified Streptomyces TaxID=2593676 RepID=UPI0013A6946F|nr:MULTISPECIES: hypothetical protein [unclassified Streptomyces]
MLRKMVQQAALGDLVVVVAARAARALDAGCDQFAGEQCAEDVNETLAAPYGEVVADPAEADLNGAAPAHPVRTARTRPRVLSLLGLAGLP